jgi:hypothetical protein
VGALSVSERRTAGMGKGKGKGKGKGRSKNERSRLVLVDLESEACFADLAHIIAEEIEVRIAEDDRRVDDPAWRLSIGRMAADALIDRFVVRPRRSETPRYRQD